MTDGKLVSRNTEWSMPEHRYGYSHHRSWYNTVYHSMFYTLCRMEWFIRGAEFWSILSIHKQDVRKQLLESVASRIFHVISAVWLKHFKVRGGLEKYTGAIGVTNLVWVIDQE